MIQLSAEGAKTNPDKLRSMMAAFDAHTGGCLGCPPANPRFGLPQPSFPSLPSVESVLLHQRPARPAAAFNPGNGNSRSLAGGWRRKDVLRFPRLEVVLGLNNVSMSIGRNVKSRPLSAGRQPGLPLAKYSHTLNWNVCESVGCPRVNNFKLIRSRQRQVFLLQIRNELIQAQRKLLLMIGQILFDGLGET